MLRDLRTEIYVALDHETNCRISIYLKDVNNDEPFKFKIGDGSEHLIVNILNDKIKYNFGSGRYWTRFRRRAASFFRSIVHTFAEGIAYGNTRGSLMWYDRIKN